MLGQCSVFCNFVVLDNVDLMQNEVDLSFFKQKLGVHRISEITEQIILHLTIGLLLVVTNVLQYMRTARLNVRIGPNE